MNIIILIVVILVYWHKAHNMAAITTPVVLTGETANTFPEIESVRKILAPGLLDPLLDPTVIRPEQAYEIVES